MTNTSIETLSNVIEIYIRFLKNSFAYICESRSSAEFMRQNIQNMREIREEFPIAVTQTVETHCQILSAIEIFL